jgi:hypothetical protein
MIRATFSETPELAARCRDFSADRGLDSAETKALLWDDYAIRPLIDTRALWREEKNLPDYDPSQPITRPLDPERADTNVHTEKGSVHCVCPVSGEQRDLAFQGFEADRNSLKYRCPAAAYGLDCQGQNECHQAGAVNPGAYGRVVRIKLEEHDRRIFVPTPHGSPSWQRGYGPQRLGAHQPSYRPPLRLRAALHPRPRQNDHPRRLGHRGDDGHGAGPYPTGPPRADALIGPADPGHRLDQHRLKQAQLDRGTAPEGGVRPSFGTDGNYSHLQAPATLPSASVARVDAVSCRSAG